MSSINFRTFSTVLVGNLLANDFEPDEGSTAENNDDSEYVPPESSSCVITNNDTDTNRRMNCHSPTDYHSSVEDQFPEIFSAEYSQPMSATLPYNRYVVSSFKSCMLI